MRNYRRLLVPGACWFFTVNLLDRSSCLLVERADDSNRIVWKVQQQRPFHIDAWVVLPEHLHAIWTLPPDDCDFPARWRDIKIAFSKLIPKGNERRVWQRGYWEHLIHDERDYNHLVDYCWFNPVKHKLVARVEDWPHSSFHRDNADRPKPGDFERALADYAKNNGTGGYGERNS